MEIRESFGDVKQLLLEKLGDRLSYEEKNRIAAGLETEFIDEKLTRLKRKAVLTRIWMVVMLIAAVAFAVTWGINNGWDDVWTYVLSAAFVGIADLAVIQHVAVQKEYTIWDTAAYWLEMRKNELDEARISTAEIA